MLRSFCERPRVYLLVGIEALQGAVQALGVLDDPQQAMDELSALCVRHG
jgi:hypothetical protein